MNKNINFAILIFATLTTACGVDVTDPQAGYFDDHQDKSGTQNFNNMGSGKMEVNINYNNQSVQPTVVSTVVPSAAQSLSTTGYLISGIQIEYIDDYLYGTNLNSNAVECDVAYRTNAPKNGSFYGFNGVKPNMSDSFYVGNNIQCVTITSVSCHTFEPYKEMPRWTGNQTICKS